MLYAILLGLDSVDPTCYPVTSPLFEIDLTKLNGSSGAAALHDVFVEFYGATTFMPAPRSADVIAQFEKLVTIVEPGDILICSYAGHGVFIDTTNADASRFANTGLGKLAKGDRHWTTSLVLEDRLMLADEYDQLLSAFGPHITVFNIIESCVSATNFSVAVPFLKGGIFKSRVPSDLVATISPTSDSLSTLLYNLDKDFYDGVLAKGPGDLRVAGIQFASASASQMEKAGIAGSPFSQSIASAIRYSDVTSYRDLDVMVKADGADTKEFAPVMFPFGAATESLLGTKFLAPIDRLKKPDVIPGD